MKYPVNGADASDGGESGIFPSPGDGTHRKAKAGNGAGAEPGADRPQPGEPPKQGHKKRRKRRRGRKVFAREAPQRPDGAEGPRPTGNGAAKPAANSGRAGASANAVRAPQPEHRPQFPPPARYRPSMGEEPPLYAALDLGTNNCRLLVAMPGRPGQFRVVDAFSRIVRLGEGLSSSGRLGEAAMDRAVQALAVCADKLRSRKVRRARLIATEACRSADNGEEFVDRVKRETGLALEIIDRKTEARLAVSGCGSLVERDTDGVVLFDIGGGSSEIALIDVSGQRSPRLANHIVSWTSLPVGVVSLAERFGGRHVTRDIFKAMVDEVTRLLDSFEGRGRLAHVSSGERFHLLGTSGTVTTLAGVHLGLERYDRRRVDGLWMENGMVDAMIDKLLGWEFEQRVANPCIGADRADLVLAGCAILEAIRRHWPSEKLRVADRGLREGMLSELMADDGVWRRGRRRGGQRS
ncbi:Ppx/GppA phosphatase family protein [Aquamicrobium sp. LC103]|uniref:Ppx/GppA phosphatase family protein n=1 Tax=Aquamicrobium sp. LC103 TaxID=1120658 RepID=UPI0009E3739D|nr:Ppx/GppA phosphatase family protein [Aquamicrobium sp. LC103]TKT75056.1 Ppx/GppA family phosphatase [Aquamicrobium sp. LC103]